MPPWSGGRKQKDEPYGRAHSGADAGARAVRRDAQLRRHSGGRAGALQERAARHHRVRGRGPPGGGDRADRGARRRACAIEREQRDRRRSPLARGRDPAQWLPGDRGHHVRHPPRDAHPCDARGRAGGARGCRARRRVGPRSPGRTRGGLRGDDAGRHRRGLSGDARAWLARPRRARSVRCRRGGRASARLRGRHHGEGLRPCRQPGRRYVRGVGHTDRQVSPVPRRTLRPDGGAARRAELPRHARVPHRQGRRPLQQLFERRQARARHRRSRQAFRARADRTAAVAVGLVDPGHEHRAVRSRRDARHRSGQGQAVARSSSCACG
jgi:hypothetical protein